MGIVVRGRPSKSIIRERMQQIVDALGVSYGYEIYKVYESAFSPIELRSMYYHLNKGLGLGEFELVGVKEEHGSFTWGDKSMRRYYVLGPDSAHTATDDLHIIIKTLGLDYKDPKTAVDWQSFLNKRVGVLEQEVSSLLKTKNVNKEVFGRLEKKISSLIKLVSDKKINTKKLESLLTTLNQLSIK